MNALWVGVSVSGCVAIVASAMVSIPEVLDRWRAGRRLLAASRARLSEVTVAGGTATPGVAFGPGQRVRWARSVRDAAGSSRFISLRRAVSGGHRRRADRDLPPLLESVARELRSGASVRGALLVATRRTSSGLEPDDPATAELAMALSVGVSVGDAVTRWVGDDASPARHLAGTALAVAAHTGGDTAAAIDGVADTLRDRVALEREVAALSSQARASTLLLVVTPVVVAAAAASADTRIAAFLLGSPAGWACVLSGLVLDAVGAAWIHLTIRRSS